MQAADTKPTGIAADIRTELVDARKEVRAELAKAKRDLETDNLRIDNSLQFGDSGRKQKALPRAFALADNDRVRAVLIDPEIIHVEGEQIGDEGCLSFPGLYQVVRREMRVIARALDINGEQFELDVRGLAARCILHETDHCDGIVFLDRMTALKRELAKRRIKRLQRSGDSK